MNKHSAPIESHPTITEIFRGVDFLPMFRRKDLPADPEQPGGDPGQGPEGPQRQPDHFSGVV
jgi:hypothetical protein